MITSPRSGCPINRGLEVLGDQWSLVILRDIAAYDRRGFRELLTGNDEGISAPVLSRRLADLATAGLLVKSSTPRGKQGRYSLTELGIATLPLMVAVADFGMAVDPSTAEQRPEFSRSGGADQMASWQAALRERHLVGKPVGSGSSDLAGA